MSGWKRWRDIIRNMFSPELATELYTAIMELRCFNSTLVRFKVYHIAYESEVTVGGQKIGVWLPVSVDVLKEMQTSDKIDGYLGQRAQMLIQAEALKYLRSL